MLEERLQNIFSSERMDKRQSKFVVLRGPFHHLRLILVDAIFLWSLIMSSQMRENTGDNNPARYCGGNISQDTSLMQNMVRLEQIISLMITWESVLSPIDWP